MKISTKASLNRGEWPTEKETQSVKEYENVNKSESTTAELAMTQDRQTDRKEERKREREGERETETETDRQKGREKEREREIDRETETERQRQRQRQTDRQTDRQTGQRDRQRDRQSKTDRQRKEAYVGAVPSGSTAEGVDQVTWA